ncbi:DoxX family protein [Streptomyces sp. GbtcB7]|uniref:DoxX family protein n=1 Tax=Streptomyces sp. GbtcB7 TaxID=2824752 RepID=UPI001C2FD883|nr:DoxX family protein [Streptomyces sp. GbtcB7]
MFITAAVLAVLLALVYLAAGAPKAAGQTKTTEQADHLGVSPGLYRAIGVLEVLGAAGVVIGLWLAWLGVAAGTGLVLLMIGAAAVHARAKDPGKVLAPAVVLALVDVAYVVLRAATA